MKRLLGLAAHSEWRGWGSRLGLSPGAPLRIPLLPAYPATRAALSLATLHCPLCSRAFETRPPASRRLFLRDHTTGPSVLTRQCGSAKRSPGQSNSRGNPGDDGFPDGLLFPEGGNGPGPNLPLPCPQGLCPRVSVQLPSISCPWVLTGPWRRAGSGLCEGTRVCSPSASIPIRRNVCVPT